MLDIELFCWIFRYTSVADIECSHYERFFKYVFHSQEDKIPFSSKAKAVK